jgi:hypothetical protein
MNCKIVNAFCTWCWYSCMQNRQCLVYRLVKFTHTLHICHEPTIAHTFYKSTLLKNQNHTSELTHVIKIEKPRKLAL